MDARDALDPIEKALDAILRLLGKLGIELPALPLRLATMLLLGVAFRVGWKATKKRASESPGYEALGLMVLVLAFLGIAWGTFEDALLPDSLEGRIEPWTVQYASVELLDYNDRPISSGGAVANDSGEFVLRYAPFWHGGARKLRIKSPGCKTREYDISARQDRDVRSWEYKCEAP